MKRTDEQIKKDIVDELYWDTRIDASKVNVSVQDGVVSLSGDVPSFEDVTAARAAAWGIAGVIGVTDDLEASYVSPPPLPSDSEIAARANSMLTWDVAIDESAVNVSVIGGVATIEGTVDTHWKRSVIENKIAAIRGIVGIENKLAVVPTKRISDEVIAQDVLGALNRDPRVNVGDIEVEVNDGVVTLSGRVSRWNERWVAEHDASLTAGVIGVENQLQLAA